MAVDRTKYNNFEMLVGRHRGLIRKLCWWRSSGDEVLCDDLIQECYLAIWLHFASLRADVAKLQETAWVVWQCRSVFSHRERKSEYEEWDTRLEELGKEIADEDVHASNEAHEILDDIAQVLTPEEQRLFALVRQDLTDLEIAERLHLKPRTVREKQRAIIEKMRKQLHDRTKTVDSK
jgi:RNA polymerase sigma factor (sigma-70 family)